MTKFSVIKYMYLKAKVACHPARGLLPVEIIERCGLAASYWSSYCGATAIFIAFNKY